MTVLEAEYKVDRIICNETVFNAAIPAYQEPLDKSGYKHVLKFDPEARNPTQKSRNRQRRISWFNPPFNMNTKTNLGAKFLKLIDKSFPVGHPLRKICNRNTIKLSYRCTPNMGLVISSRNASLLADPPAPDGHHHGPGFRRIQTIHQTKHSTPLH